MANQATPLATDGYSRIMVAGFDEKVIIGNPTGFQSIFGRPETGSRTLFATDSAVVEIDIMRGNERLAALIQRGVAARPITGQENTQTQQYTTFSRQYPLIEEEGDIGAAELVLRSMGESPYAGRTQVERLRDRASEIHNEHVRRIIRLQEVLAAQSVLLGTQVAILGTANTDLIYDFHRLATHSSAVSPLWDGVSPTIMADIDGQCDLIRQDGHANPDVMILGSEGMAAFVADTDVKSLADNRRFELIDVNSNPVPPKLQYLVDSGFIPRGRLQTPQGYTLWMFTYVEVYTNSAGTATPYMDVDKVVIFSSDARCDRYFGPPEVLPMTPQKMQFMTETFGVALGGMPPNIKAASGVITPDMFFFDAYKAANDKSVTVRTQAGVIFPTTMTDAFITITVT